MLFQFWGKELLKVITLHLQIQPNLQIISSSNSFLAVQIPATWE
jgi:hypothetical protein